MLERGLTAVVDALTSVEAKRKESRELLPLFSADVYTRMNAIDAAAAAIRDRVQGTEFEDEYLPNTRAILEQTSHIRDAISDLRRAAPSYAAVQVALGQDFVGAVQSQLNKVSALRIEAESATKAADVQRVWASTPAEFAASENFFAEYVQLLAGLALRDTGFDDGIPEIADLMIRNALPWNSLTIPAHKQPDEPTMAELVHLGYPEWTPWALPLAAYEVARFELKSGALASLVTQKEADGFDDVVNCLADMIATYMVGPAYVWARMLIRFDPAADYVKQRRVSRSFKAMVATLRSMDDPSANSQATFRNIADRIQETWDEATAEIGARQPTADELAEAGREIDDKELEAWLEDLKGYRHRALKPGDWATVKESAKRLRRVAKKGHESATTTADLRIVLNAAWLVRVDDRLDRSGDNTPLDQLAERATEAMRTMAKLPSRKKKPVVAASAREPRIVKDQ